MPACAPRRATPRRRSAAPRLARTAGAALALAALLAGCGILPPLQSTTPLVQGTGDVQAETRELAPFTRISVAADLKVIVGAADTQSVTVSAQPEVLKAIVTDVVDGQLIVTTTPPGVNPSAPMSLTVKLPKLESVALSAASVGFVEFTGGNLNLDVSGAAELTAIGDSPGLTLNATSAGKAKLGELVAQKAQVTLNDGASAELDVVGELTGTADGGSTIVLMSQPATVSVKTSNGATVQGGSPAPS